MKKKILFCLSIVACLTLLVGCSKTNKNDSSVITTDDNGTSNLTISLDSNPTTGYSWSYEIEEGKTDLFDITSEYIQNESDEDMVGVGGMDVFKIAPKSEGTFKITFRYIQAWNDTEEDVTTAEYEITIDKNLNISEKHSGSYFE